MNKAVFFDRDGVINVDTNYVYRIDEFLFCEKIFDVLSYFQSKEYLLFIITNQAGIGRGYYTEEDFFILTKWMEDEFKKKNIYFTEVYFCPFHPENALGKYKMESVYRKPNPGMILDAKKKYNLSLADSFLLGDRETDIEAGLNAGITKNFLITEKDIVTKAYKKYHTIRDFYANEIQTNSL